MEEIIRKEEQLPVVLEGLVRQGQMFLSSAAMNLMQYGRVLCEAKLLVPRGQFEKWVKENFQMSERTAQQYMAVWKRFGGKAGFETVKFSSLSKMLALPEGKEEDFAKENDLEEMTAREVDRAVKAALEAQRLEYVTYYGSEEAYQQQLEAQGITEEVYDRINETAYLYQRLQDQFCTEGSALYPDSEALAQYAADNGYLTGKAIYVPAGDGAEEEANGYLKRMQEAEDKIAEHAAICQEREVDQQDSITFSAAAGDSLSDALGQAVSALQPNEMTDVVALDDGYYIFLREETDLNAVLPTYFNALLQARRSEAHVVYNEELYAAIDTGAFYEKLTQLRSELGQTPQQAAQ